MEFINGATGSDAQKRSQGIFVSDYGDNYSSNVGSHRKFCHGEESVRDGYSHLDRKS